MAFYHACTFLNYKAGSHHPTRTKCCYKHRWVINTFLLHLAKVVKELISEPIKKENVLTNLLNSKLER